MPVLQQQGRVALAKAIAARTIHIAWGRGDPAWDNVAEPEPTDATRLVSEIGRRRVTEIGFVQPDPGGEIELPNGDRYAPSPGNAPTSWVFLRATFGFTDAQGETVREVAVFLDSRIADTVPEGQRWVLAADVTDPGDLYTLERRHAEFRSGTERGVEEIILPF
jgi:hypothetical protein